MIVAVVVTHAAPPATVAACVASVVRAGGVDSIVVVDNGTAARRDQVVAALADTSHVDVVASENRGYGAAANVGFRLALDRGAHAVALLNDDVEVLDGWLAPLTAALERPGVGASQPKLLVAGTDPPIVNSLGVRIGRDGAGTDIGDGDVDVAGSGAVPIDVFTGGAVLLAADFLRATEGFDERWFLYYEDADLSARGRELGWRYVAVLDSVVEHARGVTTGTMSARTRFLQERNRIWHAVRHCDTATVVRALWLSVRRLRHPPHAVHARALAAALAATPAWWYRRLRRPSAAGQTPR